MDGRFDDMLLGLAQKHKGIEDLLYSIMSFYERRTDLFHVKDSAEDNRGFKPGQAEEMLRKQFSHFQARYLERAQPHLLARRPNSRPAAAIADGGAPAAASSSSAPGPPRSAAEAGAEAGAGPAAVAEGAAAAGGDGAAGGRASNAPPAAIPSGVNASPLEGGDAGLWERETKQAGSGSCAWNQTTTEVNVEIDVEKCTKQDIKVVLASRKVSLKQRGETVLEGNLFDKISVEDSTWHLDEGKKIVLSLEKIRPAYWTGLFEGEQSGAPPTKK